MKRQWKICGIVIAFKWSPTDIEYFKILTSFRHEHLAARGKNIRRDLNAQVESSENHVTRINKHGRAALFFFALLGLATGAGIGSRVPGVEKAIAIPVGAVLGLIGFAVVGLFIYCIFKCRFEKRRDDWQNFQHSDLGDIALVDEINGKKSGLSEICNKLNDLEEGNMQSGRRVLAQDIEAY
jgi:hypothetical protein